MDQTHDDRSLCSKCNSYVFGEHQKNCPYHKPQPPKRDAVWCAMFAVAYYDQRANHHYCADAAELARGLADMAVTELAKIDEKDGLKQP